jgi:archaellum component FlaC
MKELEQKIENLREEIQRIQDEYESVTKPLRIKLMKLVRELNIMKGISIDKQNMVQ